MALDALHGRLAFRDGVYHSGPHLDFAGTGSDDTKVWPVPSVFSSRMAWAGHEWRRPFIAGTESSIPAGWGAAEYVLYGYEHGCEAHYIRSSWPTNRPFKGRLKGGSPGPSGQRTTSVSGEH